MVQTNCLILEFLSHVLFNIFLNCSMSDALEEHNGKV